MSRSLVRPWLLLSVLALLAVPAFADVYYVTLTNGTVVETARQPQQASWDPNMVLLLTEVGNWVGFSKDEVQSVRAEDPTQGFGIRISDKAIALGRSPNDLPTGADPSSRTKAELLTDRYLDMMQRQLDQQDARRNYTIQQFVEPGSASGIPMSYDGSSSMGAFGSYSGSYSNTPSNYDGPNSGVAFGGLSGYGSPPQQ
jgi:hypothetical protein